MTLKPASFQQSTNNFIISKGSRNQIFLRLWTPFNQLYFTEVTVITNRKLNLSWDTTQPFCILKSQLFM